MSIVLGAELGPKADPTTTTYVPRPEWYFFFLFELLRVIKPPELVPLATIGVPTICMILLFLLPFYDRSPERRPERRPIATTAGDPHDRRDGAPHLPGRRRRLAERDRHGAADGARQGAALTQCEQGKLVAAQSGCLACHKIGENGNDGPGPQLTDVGDALPQAGDRADAASTRRRRCRRSRASRRTQPEKFQALVGFLGQLK